MIGASTEPRLPTTSMTGQAFWALVVGVVAVVLVLAILGAFEKHDEEQKRDESDPGRIAGALAVGSIATVIIVIILFTDVVRFIVGTATGVAALLLTLALWRIPRSRPWQGWLAASIVSAIAYLLLALPFWWPLSLNQWLLVLLPFVAAAALGSLVGAIVACVRARAARREAALRHALSRDLAALFRAKLLNDRAAAVERARVCAEVETERLRRESIRQRNVADEARAMDIATEQDASRGPRRAKQQVALMDRVLRELYLAVGRTVRHGTPLEHLARLSRLTVEQTYSMVSTLEERQLVTTARDPERERWMQIWVYLGQAGARRVEGRRPVAKKKVTKVGKGAAYVERTGGPVAVSVVGGDVSGQVNVGVSTLDRSINDVVQAARALRAELTEQHQIEALDAEIMEVEQAKDEPAKKSALERLKGIALMLGPIAKPLLDLVNGVIGLLSPAK